MKTLPCQDALPGTQNAVDKNGTAQLPVEITTFLHLAFSHLRPEGVTFS